jgi:ATP-dependent RNA helicase DDX21
MDLRHHDTEYNVITVYGGTSISEQTYQLRRGVDVFVGTTGRVLDHMERGNLNFKSVQCLILDEADTMLNMGFKEDIDKILAKVTAEVSKPPQFLLFSATVPAWVRSLANTYLRPNWKTIDLAKNLKDKTQKNIKHISINCPFHNRMQTLADILLIYGGLGQTIVFCSTKAEANSLLTSEKITLDIEVMHGDIAQKQREVTLKRFKEQKFSVLVATDVASRGLDIPNVDLVIQVEPPKDTESYIHRAGRTARAGKTGTCITFWTMRQKFEIQRIQRAAGIDFETIGIPQPSDVIKATSKNAIKQLQSVNPSLLNLFESTADELTAQCGGDTRTALLKALAFISGCHK